MKKSQFFILALLSLTVFNLNQTKAEDNVSINDNITFYSTGSKQWYLDEGEQGLGQINISGYLAKNNNKFAIKIPDNFHIIFANNPTGELNNQTVNFIYSNDRKTVYFHSSDSSIILNGLSVKIYDQESFDNHLLLDTNDDNIFDAKDINIISIDDNDDRNENDSLRPEKINGLKTEIVPGGVKFTWLPVVDLDAKDIFVQKKINQTASQELFWNHKDLTYTDQAVKNGDELEYTMYVRDYSSWGESTIIKFDKLALPSNTNLENNNEISNDNQSNNQANNQSSDTEIKNPADKTVVSLTRAQIKDKAVEIMQISAPLDRIKAIRAEMKKLSPKDRIWLMRYIIAYKNRVL